MSQFKLRKIPFFRAGDSDRTAFSASVMNEIVGALNQFIGLRAGDGIVITRAEAGWVISLASDGEDESPDAADDPAGQSGGGSNNFIGEWNTATDYVAGDIVWRATPTNLAAGKGGMFMALVDNTNHEPPPYGTDSNDYWRVWPDTNLRLREARVCDSGTERRMLVLGTAIFDL